LDLDEVVPKRRAKTADRLNRLICGASLLESDAPFVLMPILVAARETALIIIEGSN
jgi:hypothetical protein